MGIERPVLPLPDRLEVRDRLAGPDARQDHVFFGLPIGGNDHADRLADGFGGGVAEHAFGRAVPGGDDAVQILADDGIVGRFDDAGEMSKPDVIWGLPHANGHLGENWRQNHLTIIAATDFARVAADLCRMGWEHS